MSPSVTTGPATGNDTSCADASNNPSSCEQSTSETDADLLSVIDAWPDLPEAIRAGIVSMVRAATGDGDLEPSTDTSARTQERDGD